LASFREAEQILQERDLEPEPIQESPVPDIAELESGGGTELEVEVEAGEPEPPRGVEPVPVDLATSEVHAGSAAQLKALRGLLVGDQKKRLQELENRFSEPDWLEEALPYHLPRAFQKNPERVSEALYPILGPAIRKAITAALSGTVERINQTLESSFSWEGLKLRWEASRTGVSFGELVMRNSLVYRVEQVFLIHRDTGLPLLHVVDPEVEAQDGSLVSSMLTAVQDFVQDSFGLEEDEAGLGRVQLGDLDLFIEAGPQAVGALVVRGNPPEEVRGGLLCLLEQVHASHNEALEDYDGDSAPFEEFRSMLEGLLEHQTRPGSKGIPRQVVVFWVILCMLLAYLVGGWFLSRHRWARFRAIAASKPGILVTSVERGWSKTVVTGLRDPLADPTGDLLEEAGIDSRAVDLQWSTYICLEPRIVVRRARRILKAPESVHLELYAGRLVTGGYASDAWRKQAHKLVGAIPGISGYDDTTQPRPPGV
jgi:OOP family OmpA-OmpF porin